MIHLEQIDHYNSLTTTGLARYPADNPAVEFDRLTIPDQIPAARVRNTSGTLKLNWSNQTAIPFSGYAKVHEARYRYLKRADPPYYENVVVYSDDSAIPVTIAPNGISSPVEITLGTLPNFVADGELQLKIELRGNIGSQLPGEQDSLAWGNKDVWNTFGRVYLTAEIPTDVQETPWIEVLEQACWFAQGKSAEVDVRREITWGIFNYSKKYDHLTFRFTSRVNGLNQALHLSKYFDPETEKMDCQDGASLTVAFCEAIGFETSLIYYSNDVQSFTTTRLCPAGTDPGPLLNYNFYDFTFHCVAKSGNLVYDSVAAQTSDLLGQVWRKPVYGWAYDQFPQSSLTVEVFPGQFETFPIGLISKPFPCSVLVYFPYDVEEVL